MLPISQINKLKSAIKNETEEVLCIIKYDCWSNEQANFPPKLLLTNRQVAKLRNVVANKLSLCYQKLNYLRWYNQESSLVDFLVNY